MSLDYGLAFFMPEWGDLYGLPWLGLTVPFKLKRKK